MNCYGSKLAPLSDFYRSVYRLLKNARGFYRVEGTPIRVLAILLEHRQGLEERAEFVTSRAYRRALNQRLRRALERLEELGLVERKGLAWRAK
jgi:hypothetical protein